MNHFHGGTHPSKERAMIELRWIKRTVPSVHGGELKTVLQYRQKPEKPCELFYDPSVDTAWGDWQDVPQGESNE